MTADLTKIAELIFRRRIWGLIGRVLLLGLIFSALFSVLMNDFLSEPCWALYLIFTLSWFINLGFVFEEMVKSEGWMVNGERYMVDYARWAEPLVFHFATVVFFLLLCGLIILNLSAGKYYIPDWLAGLMIIDTIVLQIIIFVDGFCLNKERIRNQVVI